MIINSHNIEFGYELISVIPYANYLASIGQLDGTISGNDTESLYFFSPNHKINPEQRSYFNISKVRCPNSMIHRNKLDKSQFLPPDYKNHFANNEFKFDKELVIICNRHNTEWHTKPINYFDLPTLRALFELLQDKYQVVYINIEGRPELYDNAPPESFGDSELLKEYPKVINIHDLHSVVKYSFNTLQLMLFANCEKYITMNGGHAILASYYGGENFIMSKFGTPQAQELKPNVNSFYRWYRDFGGQRCVHVKDEKTLIDRVKDSWIDCSPVVNILVRTANRPRFFDTCINSILEQTYKNINIFVSIDNPTYDYTVSYPVYPLFVQKQHEFLPPVNSKHYGKTIPYNLYLNELMNMVTSGLILYLDDDDMYTSKTAIQEIVKEYKNGNELIQWQVKIGDIIMPPDNLIGKEPQVFKVNGTGFAFDLKYRNDAQWEPYKRGDFRVISRLFKLIKKKVSSKKYLHERRKALILEAQLMPG